MTETLIPQTATTQAQEAQREAQEVLTIAKAVIVQNDEQYRLAGASFGAIKAKLKELEAKRVAITKPMDDAKKAVMELFRAPKEALEYALYCYERPMASFAAEQMRKKREAEAEAARETARLRKEAEERERQERERLAQIQREAEEAQRTAEAASDPVAAFVAKQQAARLAEEVEAQSTLVMDTIREKVTIEAPVEYIPTARAAGTSVRTNWKWRPVNPSLIPDEWWMLNEKLIGDHVRTYKENASIPGIEVFDEIKIGGR